MSAPLTYSDDDLCEICEFDQVEFKTDEISGVGVVTKIYPRKKAVRIKYENPNWRWKPTYKSATVAINNIVLVQRDG